jgi:hypothetical protein
MGTWSVLFTIDPTFKNKTSDHIVRALVSPNTRLGEEVSNKLKQLALEYGRLMEPQARPLATHLRDIRRAEVKAKRAKKKGNAGAGEGDEDEDDDDDEDGDDVNGNEDEEEDGDEGGGQETVGATLSQLVATGGRQVAAGKEKRVEAEPKNSAAASQGKKTKQPPKESIPEDIQPTAAPTAEPPAGGRPRPRRKNPKEVVSARVEGSVAQTSLAGQKAGESVDLETAKTGKPGKRKREKETKTGASTLAQAPFQSIDTAASKAYWAKVMAHSTNPMGTAFSTNAMGTSAGAKEQIGSPATPTKLPAIAGSSTPRTTRASVKGSGEALASASATGDGKKRTNKRGATELAIAESPTRKKRKTDEGKGGGGENEVTANDRAEQSGKATKQKKDRKGKGKAKA